MPKTESDAGGSPPAPICPGYPGNLYLLDKCVFVPMIPLERAGMKEKICAGWSEPEDVLSNMVITGHCQPPPPICGTNLFNGLGYRGDTNSSPSPSSVGYPLWHAYTTRRSQSVF